MSIENLKKILESESKGSGIKYDEESCTISLDGKEIGQWNNEASHDYPEDLIWHRDISGFHHKAFKSGHEAATNRLLPLLEKAVEMANYYGGENYESCYEDDEMDLNRILDREDVSFDEQDKYFGYAGEKAREFLEEFTKMTEIKKESGK